MDSEQISVGSNVKAKSDVRLKHDETKSDVVASKEIYVTDSNGSIKLPFVPQGPVLFLFYWATVPQSTWLSGSHRVLSLGNFRREEQTAFRHEAPNYTFKNILRNRKLSPYHLN